MWHINLAFNKIKLHCFIDDFIFNQFSIYMQITFSEFGKNIHKLNEYLWYLINSSSPKIPS